MTLGSASDHSRLRFCFEHLSAESGLDPYNPATSPWQFVARGPESTRSQQQSRIDAVIDSHVVHAEGYAGQFERLDEALSGRVSLPVTLADARASLELVTAIYTADASGRTLALPLKQDALGYHDWRMAPIGST